MDTTEVPLIKSKFNSAQLDLFRIHDLWRKTHYYAEKGMLHKWNIVLDRIYQELSNDTKEADDEIFDDFQKEIKDTPKNNPNSVVEFYELISLKERFIRKLQNKQGKGTSYDDYDYGIS